MRGILVPLILAGLGLAAGCSSNPSQEHARRPMRPALPDCAVTGGYPPCVFEGGTPYLGPDDFYPAYDYPFFPGSGVVVVPEPVPVPVPPTKPPKRPVKPPIKPHRHPHEPRPVPCHPEPGHPCP